MRHLEAQEQKIGGKKMKRSFLLLILVIGMLLFSACGTPETIEQPAQSPAPQQESPVKPTPASTPEQQTRATFTISSLSISPTEINTGERITISAFASNRSFFDGNYKVIFKIDNEVVETVEVPLASGDMKKVDFAATVDYAPGTYSVDVNGLLGSFMVKEPPEPEPPAPEPTAEFTITGFDQTYSDLLKRWKSVYINYTIQNNGEVHISYYKVYFTITCDDGSRYQSWTNGSHIFVGQELSDSEEVLVEGKEVTSVEIDNYELLAGEVPNEITSAEFTITGFDQTYYEGLKEWSNYVDINYIIQNTGEAHIAFCRIYFTITFDDGSQYQGWTREWDILVGQKWYDSTIVEVEGKKVTSVELTDWDLLAGEVPEVIYEITGTADKVDVTLSNASGGTEQYDDVYLPKKYDYGSFSDSFLYISAQNQGDSGSVTVSIYINGRLFKTSRSSGAYVIASASGSK